MKVKDESIWQQQCADFAKDPAPSAAAFQKFLVAWAEAAEEYIETHTEKGYGDFGDEYVNAPTPAEALNKTLRHAESTTGGRWPVPHMGMALVILSTHWAPARDTQHFMDGMTSIEQNLLLDTLAAHKEEMERVAAEEVTTNG